VFIEREKIEGSIKELRIVERKEEFPCLLMEMSVQVGRISNSGGKRILEMIGQGLTRVDHVLTGV